MQISSVQHSSLKLAARVAVKQRTLFGDWPEIARSSVVDEP